MTYSRTMEELAKRHSGGKHTLNDWELSSIKDAARRAGYAEGLKEAEKRAEKGFRIE